MVVVQKLLPLIECRFHIDLLPETVFDSKKLRE